MKSLANTSAFAFRDFRFYWFMRLFNTLAIQMLSVAIGWQVYDVARQTRSVEESAFLLGMIGLAQFLPLFFLTLIAGYAADRLDRRWIGRAAITLEVTGVALLLIESLSATISLPVVFVVAAMLGAARALAAPAFQALAPNLVSKEVLPSAIALSSLAWQGASVVGPAIGGYVYVAGASAAYAVCLGLLLMSLGLAFMLRPVPRPPVSSLTPWQSVKEGLAYVRTNRVVFGAVTLDLFAVLLGGATALLPVFARDVLHVGPEGLGHLRAAPAAGAVVVAMMLAVWPLRRRMGLVMFWSVGVFGVLTALFGLSTNFTLSLCLLAMLGAVDMISVYVRQSIVQIFVPDAMRGRVASVSTLCISASNELGEFESGVAARFLGAVGAVVFGGVGAISITALWAWKFPELRRTDRLDSPPV